MGNMLAPQLWRGLLRQGWGRLMRNPRLVNAGRMECALARIARAHLRINREAQRDIGHWLEYRARHFPRPSRNSTCALQETQLRLVR
jgi:hypothetical protein